MPTSFAVPYPDTSAAYATITNATDKFVSIKGVESACCEWIAMARSFAPKYARAAPSEHKID
jgi:hypothetical protein